MSVAPPSFPLPLFSFLSLHPLSRFTGMTEPPLSLLARRPRRGMASLLARPFIGQGRQSAPTKLDRHSGGAAGSPTQRGGSAAGPFAHSPSAVAAWWPACSRRRQWTRDISEMRRKKGVWENWWLFPFIWGLRWEFEGLRKNFRERRSGGQCFFFFWLQSPLLLVLGKED